MCLEPPFEYWWKQVWPEWDPLRVESPEFHDVRMRMFAEAEVRTQRGRRIKLASLNDIQLQGFERWLRGTGAEGDAFGGFSEAPGVEFYRDWWLGAAHYHMNMRGIVALPDLG